MLYLPVTTMPLQIIVLFLGQHHYFFLECGTQVYVWLRARLILEMQNMIHVLHLNKKNRLCPVLFSINCIRRTGCPNVYVRQALSLYQISEVAGVDLGGGLTSHLKNLESAGFISSATPFHKGHNSRLLKYFLSDAYLRFYFSFVQPNLKKIKSGIQTDLFGKIAQSGAFNEWIGHIIFGCRRCTGPSFRRKRIPYGP